MFPQLRRVHAGAYIWLLAILIAVIALLYIFRVPLRAPVQQPAPQDIQIIQPAAPAPNANNIVTAQRGFQHLVSFTGAGFRPAALSVAGGETVRFTNNSPSGVQITYADSQSPLLARGEYWEYTLPATSTTRFTYTAGGFTGTVTVK